MTEQIQVGDTVTFRHRHFDGMRTETGIVESFVNGRARVRTAPRRITEMGIGALTRVDPSTIRRVVDSADMDTAMGAGDFGGREG